MPEYLWTAKDKFGNPVVERINAASAEQAKAELESREYSDLKLHTEAAIAEVFQKDERGVKFSPADQLKFQYAGHITFLEAWGRIYKEAKFTTAILFAVSFLCYIQGQYWIAAFCVGWLVLFPGIDLWFTQSSRVYARLNKARVWYRWGDVMMLVAQLRRLKRWTRIGPAEIELLRCEAQALAGQGYVDEGLKMFDSLEEASKTPRWLVLSFRASILDVAKRHHEVIAVYRQALELEPESPILLIDLAGRIAHFQEDPSEAKELLRRAEASVLSEMAKPFAALCWGIIGWRDRDYATSQARLEEALLAFEIHQNNPLAEGSVFGAKAYLCCVEGALGNLPEARRLFSEVKEFLEATGETELLQDCRTAAQFC